MEQVAASSAGLDGWKGFDPTIPVRVGEGVHSGGLCGLWLRQARLAAPAMPDGNELYQLCIRDPQKTPWYPRMLRGTHHYFRRTGWEPNTKSPIVVCLQAKKKEGEKTRPKVVTSLS